MVHITFAGTKKPFKQKSLEKQLISFW